MSEGGGVSLGFAASDGLALATGFLLALALSSAVAFFANRHWEEGEVLQPIEFNHRIHVEDEGLECSQCHTQFEEGVHSGMPPTSLCALCHEEAQGESPGELRLVRMLEEGRELEWESVFRQPPHVFFSHSRHVTVAGIECTVCHGEVGTSERPPRAGSALTMDDCLSCHEREEVSDACSRCHR